jgi:hypothetical protein
MGEACVSDPQIEGDQSGLDRRSLIKKMAVGAFAVPVIVSFQLDSLARAGTLGGSGTPTHTYPNQTHPNQTHPNQTHPNQHDHEHHRKHGHKHGHKHKHDDPPKHKHKRKKHKQKHKRKHE